MFLRVRFEPLLPFNRAVDLSWGDRPLFDKPMRDDRRGRPVEEIQNPVMNSLKADAEFINPVLQEVGLGPPQFVSQLAQPLQSEIALVLYFRGQLAEPVQEWA